MKASVGVVAVVPNEDAVVGVVGALLLEPHDRWARQPGATLTPDTLDGLSDDASDRPRRIAAA